MIDLDYFVRITLYALGLEFQKNHGECIGSVEFNNRTLNLHINPLFHTNSAGVPEIEYELVAASADETPTQFSCVIYIFSQAEIAPCLQKYENDTQSTLLLSRVIAFYIQKRCPSLTQIAKVPDFNLFSYVEMLLRAQFPNLGEVHIEGSGSPNVVARCTYSSTLIKIFFHTGDEPNPPAFICGTPRIAWKVGECQTSSLTFNSVVVLAILEAVSTNIVCESLLNRASQTFKQFGFSRSKYIGNKLEVTLSAKLTHYMEPAYVSAGPHYLGSDKGFVLEFKGFDEEAASAATAPTAQAAMALIDKWAARQGSH